MKDLQELLNRMPPLGAIEDLHKKNPKEKVKKRLEQLNMPNESVSHRDPLTKIGQERLMGKNNLMDITYFYKGLEVSRSVCRVVSMWRDQKTAMGTGFLVSPSLMMTNHHVINSRRMAKLCAAEFEYEHGPEKKPDQSYLFQLDPDTFFLVDEDLDYALIAVSPIAQNAQKKELSDYPHIPLKRSLDKILVEEAVSIIQHPDGLPKMIAIRDNQVIAIQEPFIHYLADTQRGSSGSLVANDQWDIIALHHKSVYRENENGEILLRKGGVWQSPADDPFIDWIANEGVLIDYILEDVSERRVKTHEEELKAELLKEFEELEKEDAGYTLPTERIG